MLTILWRLTLLSLKSLKIPKGYSEAVNETTDNTMAKRKITNNDQQNTTQATTNRATLNPLKTRGKLKCSKQRLLHM